MENKHQYVEDVLKQSYRIPKYQRGYRWTKEHVEKLLEDVYEDRLLNDEQKKNQELNEYNAYNCFWSIAFEQNEKTKMFNIPKLPYCIQPLVVLKQKNTDYYDVIDGQQRLTSIVIIRAALRQVAELSDEIKKPNIVYESRENSKKFLESLYTEVDEKDIKNLDFAYMYQAFKIAVEFFEKELEEIPKNIKKMYGKYLDDVLCKNTRFIWYQVDNFLEEIESEKLKTDLEEEQKTEATNSDREESKSKEIDAQKVFANFNTGKIELTNAELIKALFMNPSNYNTANIKDKQIVMSEKWDEMENQLHDPQFWAFIPHPGQYETNIKEYTTRIDLLFDFLVMEIWIERSKQKIETDVRNEIANITMSEEDISRKIDNEVFQRYMRKRNSELSDKYIFNKIEKWFEEDCKKNKEEKEIVLDRYWRKLKKIFSDIKELYASDNNVYNIVGLYINLKNRKNNCSDTYTTYINDNYTYLEIYYELRSVLQKTRIERISSLKTLIKNLLIKNHENLKELILKSTYNDTGNKASNVVKILLTYNIAVLSTSKGTGERFNFLANAQNNWEKEHIFAQKVDIKLDAIKDKNQNKAILEILASNAYLEYLKYLFEDKENKNIITFQYEKTTEILDLEHLDKDMISKFIKSNLRYGGNGKYELFARALEIQKKAEELLELYKNIEAINRILEEKDSYIKNLLLYKYLGQLQVQFDSIKNVNLKYYKDKEDIKSIILCATSKDISFDKLHYSYQYQDYDKHKENWREWLNEFQLEDNIDNDENEEDGVFNIKTNLEKLVNRINKDYRETIQKTIYEQNNILKPFDDIFTETNKEFIYTALEVNQKTLIAEIQLFFTEKLYKLLEDNYMGNITLLTGNKQHINIEKDIHSSNQNQLVSNKTYTEKKEEVYAFYKSGQFVPLGTLFVFTDLYTKGTATDLWLPNSRLEYLKDMVETISDFFKEEIQRNE